MAMAEARVGSTSMPHWCTRKPKNLSAETPNFERIHFELVEAISLKDFSQNGKMVLPLLGFDYNIIDVVFDLAVHHVMEHGYHRSLIRGPSIFKTKRHDDVVEISNRCAESGFFSIFRRHEYLIISVKTIHKREHNMARP